MSNKKEQDLLEILDKLEIKYEIHEHEAIKTVEEADQKNLIMPGLNLKNLLIKDKKNKIFYLVILDDHKALDMKKFKELIDSNKTTFASSEELFELLNLVPGEVGPFGLIYDKKNIVKVVLETEIEEAENNTLVNFHPNRNTATLSLTKKDFIRYLKYLNKDIMVLK